MEHLGPQFNAHEAAARAAVQLQQEGGLDPSIPGQAWVSFPGLKDRGLVLSTLGHTGGDVPLRADASNTEVTGTERALKEMGSHLHQRVVGEGGLPHNVFSGIYYDLGTGRTEQQLTVAPNRGIPEHSSPGEAHLISGTNARGESAEERADRENRYAAKEGRRSRAYTDPGAFWSHAEEILGHSGAGMAQEDRESARREVDAGSMFAHDPSMPLSSAVITPMNRADMVWDRSTGTFNYRPAAPEGR